MNINDVPKNIIPEVIELKWFFDQQRELIIKYLPIEMASGCIATDDCPVDINSPKGQTRLKEMMWRTTEELMEAYEELMKNDNTLHFKEEIIDAFHFLLELIILADKVPPVINYITNGKDFHIMYDDMICYDEPDTWYMIKTVYHLGMAGNCLKQKPWKQTHQLIDDKKFTDQLCLSFIMFLILCKHFTISVNDLYQLYFKKNAVNQFRIRSKY